MCKNDKKVKKEYFKKLKLDLVTDKKKFWKTIKPYFSETCNKKEKIVLVEEGELIFSTKKTAEIMNNHFVNIAVDLELPTILVDPTEVSKPNNSNNIEHIVEKYSNHPSIRSITRYVKLTNRKFSFNKIDVPIIEREILNLNSKKAAGCDGIPPKILKDAIGALKSPLTFLFNYSIENCSFPSDLKYANVSPHYKKDDNTNKKNYRPISILPTISKIYERLMLQQVSLHVSEVISTHLCGFRKGYNAQHPLLKLKDKLNKNLDISNKVGLLLMDLSKAFDCIPHELMIAKLHAYG